MQSTAESNTHNEKCTHSAQHTQRRLRTLHGSVPSTAVARRVAREQWQQRRYHLTLCGENDTRPPAFSLQWRAKRPHLGLVVKGQGGGTVASPSTPIYGSRILPKSLRRCLPRHPATTRRLPYPPRLWRRVDSGSRPGPASAGPIAPAAAGPSRDGSCRCAGEDTCNCRPVMAKRSGPTPPPPPAAAAASGSTGCRHPRQQRCVFAPAAGSGQVPDE